MNKEEILQRLEQIEARVARATPGPWESDGVRVYSMFSDREYGMVADCDLSPRDPSLAGQSDGGLPANPDFIAHARGDIPWLCGVIRELLTQNDALREACRDALAEIEGALEQAYDVAGERERLPIERKLLRALRQ